MSQVRLTFTSAAAIALTAALLLTPGCSKKSPVEGPVFPPPDGVTVQGRTVRWSSSDEARVTVRYGDDLSRLDHMAYPAAAGRRDRAFVKDHAIDLLDLEKGRTIYFQLGVETRLSPAIRFSPVDSFTASVGPAPGQLISTMVHIGFGDCHVLTMPNGKRVLLDSGGSDADFAVRQYLSEKGINSIDYMLATHVHLDHLGGIIGSDQDGILDSHPPSVFLDSSDKDEGSDKWAYGQLQQMLSSGGVIDVVLERYDTSATVPELRWDPDVEVLILNSGTPEGYVATGFEGTDINNESIVVRVSYGDVDFVIGGDAEQESEASMAAAFAGWDLDSEYYKTSHHGLPDASSSLWVNILRPRVSFITNTSFSWNGDLDGALSQTMSTLAAVSAHAYAIDDVPLLGASRRDGIQHNVSFATDGVSYEVRVEVATQTAPRKSASTAACIHGDPDLQEFLEYSEPDPSGRHQE